MQIKDMIAVLQAAERGEEIEYHSPDSDFWATMSNPKCWDFSRLEYRIKPKPRTVPLGPEDVPPGSLVRHSQEHTRYWYQVQAVHDMGISISRNEGFLSFVDMIAAGWQISRDGGRRWKRCEKPESV